MADLETIRKGLAANLKAIKGCQVSAYMLEEPRTPSLMVVGPESVEYDLTMNRGLDRMTIVLQGFTGSITDRGRQAVLDEWLAPSGAKSVKAAVESDVTLGGTVAGVRVMRVDSYRDYALANGTSLFGATWFIDIFNPGR